MSKHIPFSVVIVKETERLHKLLIHGRANMKRIDLLENGFSELNFRNFLVHDSPYFKILNFNFKAGQTLPIHSHDLEGQVSIAILEGEGEFLGDAGLVLRPSGSVLISDIAEPHGLRAKRHRVW